MRQIFDHRETVTGLRRVARAVCEGVRARWRDGAGSLLTLGIRSCRCLHTHWRGRSTRRTLEHREAVVGRCPRQRKVCESVRERRCDVSGSLVTFSFRLHRRLHTSWRGWWAPQIFRHRETVLGLCRWPRAVCESVGELESWRARWRDGAGCVRALGVSSHTRTLAHMLAPLYDGTDFRPSRNGDGAEPAGACSLRGCESAMARRRRQFAHIGYPVTKMLAHTLARAVDETDS